MWTGIIVKLTYSISSLCLRLIVGSKGEWISHMYSKVDMSNALKWLLLDIAPWPQSVSTMAIFSVASEKAGKAGNSQIKLIHHWTIDESLLFQAPVKMGFIIEVKPADPHHQILTWRVALAPGHWSS